MIVEFSHLAVLYFGDIHLDYLEEFFLDSNISMPCLTKMRINYQDLVTVTKSFTRNETRAISSKVKDT